MSSQELPPSRDQLQAAINLCPVIKSFLAIQPDSADSALLYADNLTSLHESLERKHPNFDEEVLGGMVSQIDEQEVLVDMSQNQFENVADLLAALFMLGYELANPDVEKQGGEGITPFIIDSIVDHTMQILGPEEFFLDEYKDKVFEILFRIIAAGVKYGRDPSRTTNLSNFIESDLSPDAALRKLMSGFSQN